MAREFDQLDAQGYPALPATGLAAVDRPVRLAGWYEALKPIVRAIYEQGGARAVGKAAVGSFGTGAAVTGGLGLGEAIKQSSPDESSRGLPPGFKFVDEPPAETKSSTKLPPGFQFIDEAQGAQVPPVTAVSDPNERVKAAFGAFPAQVVPPRPEPPDLRTAILNHLLTTPAR